MIAMELISDIGKIIVFLMLLLAVFLFTVKAKNQLSNRLFAGFLLVTALDISGLFLSNPFENNPSLFYFKIASVLLQMPLFYLYVLSVCYNNFRLGLKHLIHGLLFLVFLIVFVITGFSESSYRIYGIIAELQYFGYIIGVLLTLRTYKQIHLENYSGADQSTYKWILQITILFLVGHSFVILRSFSTYFQNNALLSYLNLIISLFALVVICWFVLKALYQPAIFSGVDKNLSTNKPSKKNTTTNASAFEKEIQQLSTYMNDNKPYLNAELTLQQLATEMDMPEKQLSALINHQIGQHFFDYINAFRIEEAKHLLSAQADLTVSEILYQVGFNSKSSFYTAFKKHTAQTPTAYRKSIT
jgi:AraC-like DNA-binding protein